MNALRLPLRRAADLSRRDPVLCAAALAATLSAFWVPPSADYLDYLDWRVLCLLLSLMLVVAGLKSAGVFDAVTGRLLRAARNTRALAAALTGLCYFASMLITNDVALITFVPLAILTLTRAGKPRLLIPVITLQTVAANLGSMFTPLGNPQNLYLYSYYHLSAGRFLGIMLPPTALSLAGLCACLLLIRPEPLAAAQAKRPRAVEPARALPWAGLFIACLLAVLRVIPYLAALALVVAGVLMMDRSLLRRADYGLLLTFVFLFILTGNLQSVPAIRDRLSALVSGREVAVGVLLSQIISNVPAAMLLSRFTANGPALLVGVNLGGLGTLIASMASVISYKLYLSADGVNPRRYLVVFTAVNILFLAVLCAGAALLPPV